MSTLEYSLFVKSSSVAYTGVFSFLSCNPNINLAGCYQVICSRSLVSILLDLRMLVLEDRLVMIFRFKVLQIQQLSERYNVHIQLNNLASDFVELDHYWLL